MHFFMKKLYSIIFLLVLFHSNFAFSAKSKRSFIAFEKNAIENPNNSIPKNFALPTATISPSVTTVCVGDTSPVLTLTGSGGTAPYTFTYSLNGTIQPIIVSSGVGNTVTISTPTDTAGDFVYTLVSVSDSSGTQLQSESATVTVNPLPVVDFNSDANSNTCSGDLIQFNSTVIGTGPYTYLWDFGDGITSTVANPLHALSSLGCTSGLVPVRLTITDANGCESVQVTKSINIKSKPDISFSDDNNPFASEPFSNCQSASATNSSYTIKVRNTSASASCIASYSIDWGDGNSASSVSFPISHEYTSLGVYNMVITAIGTNNCSNSKTYLVKNISNPGLGIQTPSNTQDLCAPTDELAFEITGWGNNYIDTTYEINYGDGLGIKTLTQTEMVNSRYYNTSNPSLSLDYPIPYSYTTSSCPGNGFTLTVSAINACKTTTLNYQGITIFKKTIVGFTAPLKACSNTSVLFRNTTNADSGQNCSQNSIYTWDFGDGTIITTPLQSPQNINHTYEFPGIYDVTLSSQNFCGISTTIPQTICIEETPLVPTFTLSQTENCSPVAVTATTVIPTNVCSTPTYSWKVSYTSGNCGSGAAAIPDQTTQNATYDFVTPGTYSITLITTNSCGAKTSLAQTVVVKQPPTVAINTIADSCGPITISPTATITNCGIQSPLIYEWIFTGGTPSSSNLAVPGSISYSTSGTHTVSLTVTNECGLTKAVDETFTINPIPVLTNTDLSQTICSGLQTTLVNLTSNLADTTFSWTAIGTTGISGFATLGTTNTIPVQTISTTATSPGTVTYYITPLLNGCAGVVVDYVVNVDPAPTITQPASSSVCLGGTPTPLSVSVSNAIGIPSYQWYSNSNNNTTSGTSIPDATNATYTPPDSAVGTIYYYCIVSLPSGGCSNLTSNTAEVTIAPLATISTQPIPTQKICVGGTIDALEVSYTGGTGTASYQWYSNTSNTNFEGVPISGAESASYTPPVFNTSEIFYYYVELTFTASGCGSITSYPAEIVVVEDPIVSSPLVSQNLCQGATAADLTVTASGGIETNYSYQWYSNSLNSNTSGSPVNGATTNTFTPPTTSSGTIYYYVVIQQTGLDCSVTSATAEVIVNATPVFTSQPISESICLNEQLTLSVVYNGLGTPQYQWYINDTNSASEGTAILNETAASYTFSPTTVGTNYYYVSASSTSGCSDIISTIAEVKVSQNPVITDQSATICSGNPFTITPDNTTGDLLPAGTTYTWTNPSISPVGSITGASAQTSPKTNISQTLTNTTSSPATVTYTVTPLSGVCTGADFTIVVSVNPAISPNISLTDSNCFGANNGSIFTNISGGIPYGSGESYLISWTYPDGSTKTTASISNLAPGNYTLSITDDSTCSFLKIYTIEEPKEIIITTDLEKDISCFGYANGSIAITVTGGTPDYTYAWTKDGVPYAISEDISNLGPGEYEVTVSDANNCVPVTSTFTISEPDILALNKLSQTDVLCFGYATGAITVDVVGGTLPYTFAWAGPNGFSSPNQNLTAIPAGTYNLKVTDASGCSVNLSPAVTITQNPEIVITATTTPIICYGGNDASIRLAVSGGVGDYDIQWSNLASGDFQDNLSAGDYVITVTDDLGCPKTVTVTITEPPVFKVDHIVKPISCFGENDASINLSLLGGISPVSVVWNDGSTAGLTRNNLGPGTYIATITDGKPCTITEPFVIIEPQTLVLSANVTEALNCDNANSGAINLLVSGGTSPYTYAWSNGATTEDLINVPAGNYSVTVTDARGCTKSIQKSINRPLPLVIGVETKTEFNCDTKYVKQTFVAQASGGVPPYQYVWSSGTISGANNEMMTSNQNGTVILNVTDNLGCPANYSFNVEIPILGSPSFDLTSFGFTTYGIYSIIDPIQFTNTATGDFINISWDFGDGSVSNELNPIHFYTKEGSYVVTQTVTYPLGCIYTNKITLAVTKGYELLIPNAFTPNTDGINETFRPVFKGLKSLQLDVYDTWGELIYTEEGETLRGWNGELKGRESENGNYYYKVSTITFYGTIINEHGPFVLIK